MSIESKEVYAVNIEHEMRQSYLDYAMSVIVGRALPDVRDGLKPVHRRVLYAMYDLKNDYNKAYKKSARVVGDVIGKYHPHGDSAVYDTIVRMAQPFSLRYMLIDGQGNFGSVDGDSAAAMRYTEIRMAKISHELLSDLDKETVDFLPNYDNTEFIPDVLPTRIPNLLVNGSTGIAVGMATNIPPHNLTEVINGCLLLIDNETNNIETSINDLLEVIQGPDFPTAAIINGRAGIVKAYQTGRGRIFIRSKAEVETDSNGRERIIVHELPYQVNKARLIERIAELVKEKKIEGISELRDESDKDGLRVVIELKRGEVGDVVLNNLYAHTSLQVSFGINMVCLVNGQPKTLNLKELLTCFIQHRREVVTRRSLYLLKKARVRAHILEGLAIAIANIDEVIELVRSSATPAEAKEALLARQWSTSNIAALLEKVDVLITKPADVGGEYGNQGEHYLLSPQQAQAILDLRLHRLTGLEYDKLIDEYKAKLDEITALLKIIHEPDELTRIVREELENIISEYHDERRTEIISSQLDLSEEDLIPEEQRVVTLSHMGYAKSQALADYQAQRRGGTGKSATSVKEEDWIDTLLIASTHDTILCFSNHGKVYWLRVFQIPVASRQARGRPMVNLLPLDEGEKITSMLPVKHYDDAHYILMATSKGTIKKTILSAFSRQRNSGLRAIELGDDDYLIGTAITNGNQDIMLFSNAGKAVRFAESTIRATGRTSKGVRGIRLKGSQLVISLIVPEADGKVLTLSENGYGKQTLLNEYTAKGRGGQGMIAMQTSDRNGEMIGALQVFDGDEVMLITDAGTLVRTRVNEISTVGRNTQGVRVIRLKESERVISIGRINDDTDVGIDADSDINTEANTIEGTTE